MLPREIIPELWHGAKPKAVRYYYYIRMGLDFFNSFRYVIMSIFALYYMMKLDNIAFMPLMFAVCLPIFFIVGYCEVHHMRKITEYIGVQFSSHWSRYGVDLQEQRNELLREIVEELRKEK